MRSPTPWETAPPTASSERALQAVPQDAADREEHLLRRACSMLGKIALSSLALGVLPKHSRRCRGLAVPRCFSLPQPLGRLIHNPGRVTKTFGWAFFFSLPPLSLSGTVWVPQVTPISGLRLLLAGSSSATHLPVLPGEGRAGAELGLGEFFNTQIYSSSRLTLGTQDQQDPWVPPGGEGVTGCGGHRG